MLTAVPLQDFAVPSWMAATKQGAEATPQSAPTSSLPSARQETGSAGAEQGLIRQGSGIRFGRLVNHTGDQSLVHSHAVDLQQKMIVCQLKLGLYGATYFYSACVGSYNGRVRQSNASPQQLQA